MPTPYEGLNAQADALASPTLDAEIAAGTARVGGRLVTARYTRGLQYSNAAYNSPLSTGSGISAVDAAKIATLESTTSILQSSVTALQGQLTTAIASEAAARSIAIESNPDGNFEQIFVTSVAPALNTEIPPEVLDLSAEMSEEGDVASVWFKDAIRHYKANVAGAVEPWAFDKQYPLPGFEGFADAGPGNTSRLVKELVDGFWYFAVANDTTSDEDLQVPLSTIGSEGYFKLQQGIQYHVPAMAHHYVAGGTHPTKVLVGAEFYTLTGSPATIAEKQANPTLGGKWSAG